MEGQYARPGRSHGLDLGDVGAPLNPDAALDRLRHRAARVVQPEGALRLFTPAFRDRQLVCEVHPGEQEDFLLSLLDIPLSLRLQRTAVCWDLARFQRTRKRAGHSRGDGGHHVIEGGR